MYKKGNYVIKIPEGICEIEDVGCLDISGVNKDKEYYALAPINQKGSKIYIPVDNVHGRIRNIISKEDAIAFIKSMPDIDEKDIQNEKMREQEYKAVILSGDNEKIASILKLIYSRKQERAECSERTYRAVHCGYDWGINNFIIKRTLLIKFQKCLFLSFIYHDFTSFLIAGNSVV